VERDLDSLIIKANSELKKIALWFRANKMAVNIGKTKYNIFHNKCKCIDMNDRQEVYDDNEPFSIDPHLVVPLERYPKDHPLPECRAYKLLGIYVSRRKS
jgi:hypothetical protein